MKKDIITVIGSLNYDIIFKQKRLAQKGETYTADSVNFAGGGKGANQAVQCAKLGVPTYMVGAVGKDSFGDYLLDELNKYGVHTEYVRRVGENTGIGVVNCMEDGTVIATISTGANYTLTKEDINKLKDIIASSKIIILQMEIPVEVVEYAIEIGHQNGCFIILNAAPAKPIAETALRMVNCLIVNEPEASFYCGGEIKDFNSAEEHCEQLFAKIKDVLIITLGENGSLVYDGKIRERVKANKVQVVETTGAGDSYIGAFASKLLEGYSYIAAAKYSAAAAAITVTGIGAQSSMPTLEQVKQ
jgi:ribokinase